MMQTREHALRNWGFGGAFFALVFAAWMLFFPDLVISYFVWPAEPRLTQAFIGAGYIFRTGFFLSVAFERAWHRVRWIFWGNLVFTGTLLLATFWHADRLSWFSPVTHLWIFLYVAEPIAMLYLAPREAEAWSAVPTPRGPIQRALKWLLVVEAAVLFTFGIELLLNPEFADLRWMWKLNPLDARMIAAWFLGWATWAGTLAFARDWDEVRLGVRLNILFGLALLGTIVALFSQFDFTRVTTSAYMGAVGVLTLLMIYFYRRHERASAPSTVAAPAPEA